MNIGSPRFTPRTTQVKANNTTNLQRSGHIYENMSTTPKRAGETLGFSLALKGIFPKLGSYIDELVETALGNPHFDMTSVNPNARDYEGLDTRGMKKALHLQGKDNKGVTIVEGQHTEITPEILKPYVDTILNNQKGSIPS
jgi:hypothetical protein